MTENQIPEAAVEAAVEAHCEGTMRAALEAALPYLMESAKADAWDEGSIAGWVESGLPHSWHAENSLRNSNPYRPTP